MIDVKFSQDGSFDVDFSPPEQDVDLKMDHVTEVFSNDHRKLINRDSEDQHPINSITGLNDQLGNKVVRSDRITNTQIESILSM